LDLIEQIGAILGLAAFLGLAVLVLLYFQQARDVRRLREWAGRAPERAAERAEEAAAAAAEEAGLAGEETEAGPPRERLHQRVLSRVPVPSGLRDRLPEGRYLAVIGVGVAIVAAGIATVALGVFGDGDGKGGKPLPPGKIEVAVLNGTAVAGSPGVPGLAEAVAREVKSDGFDVGQIGDAGSFVDTLAAYNKPEDRGAAQQVKEELSKQLENIKLGEMSGDIRGQVGSANVAVIIGQNNSNPAQL
jgi:LytR cell envelope-related transcriptional attenuator